LTTLSTNHCNSFMDCNGAVVTFSPTATMNDAGGLIVGVHAQGTFIAQGSGAQHAVINSRDGKIGQHLGSNGSMTVDDAVWHNSERMFVGLSGQGSLTVSDAGHVTAGDCFGIGVNKGGTGHVTLSGGSTLSVGTFAVIGGNGIDTDTPPPSGTGIGTGTLLVESGSAFSVVQSLKISAGSAARLDGGTISVGNAFPGLTILSGGTLSGNGTVNVGPATGKSAGITDGGVVSASGGTLVLNSVVSGTGQMQIADGSTLVLNGSSIGVPSIAFTGSTGTLSLAHGIAEHATITGFGAGDSILMAGVDGMSFNASTDVMTLTSGTQVVDTLHLSGSYASNAFTLTQSGADAMIGFASAHPAVVH
jgi:T5SS/PEP-CTERM-associated repeat protein